MDKNATCTATGLTEGSHCKRCKEVLTAQKVTPALDHKYIYNKCNVCGAYEKLSAPTLSAVSNEKTGVKVTWKAVTKAKR